jgi:predicted negative regulator of RcsB-dependent stress response
LTRHELKEQLDHDQFTESVSGALKYATSHKQRMFQWGAIVLVVLLLVGGAFWLSSYRRGQREADLQAAFTVLDAQVGPHSDYAKTYATQDEKLDASIKALQSVVEKDRGTREGYLAQYYLGTLKAQKSDDKGAEADLRVVADSSSDSAALAKIALAQLYVANNRATEAQDLLKSVVNKPTDLVSKAQAQVLLAQLDERANPQEAKRILQELKKSGASPAVTRAADQIAAPSATK